MTVASTRENEPFPRGTEERLEEFTEVVAIAIANAEARDELRQVAAEQRTLRRVATLVARARAMPRAHDCRQKMCVAGSGTDLIGPQLLTRIQSVCRKTTPARRLRSTPGPTATPTCSTVGLAGAGRRQAIGEADADRRPVRADPASGGDDGDRAVALEALQALDVASHLQPDLAGDGVEDLRRRDGPRYDRRDAAQRRPLGLAVLAIRDAAWQRAHQPLLDVALSGCP
jgi:hypothetical protein